MVNLYRDDVNWQRCHSWGISIARRMVMKSYRDVEWGCSGLGCL